MLVMGKRNLVSIPVFYGLQLEVMAVLVEDASLNTATGNLDIFPFWKPKYASHAFNLLYILCLQFFVSVQI